MEPIEDVKANVPMLLGFHFVDKFQSFDLSVEYTLCCIRLDF